MVYNIIFMFTSQNKRIQSQICMKLWLIKKNIPGVYCELYVKANHLTKFLPLLNLEVIKNILWKFLLIIISCPDLLLTNTLFDASSSNLFIISLLRWKKKKDDSDFTKK